MDCQRFATQMKYVKNMADAAVAAVEGGDSKRASEALDSLERVLETARANLGKVGA